MNRKNLIVSGILFVILLIIAIVIYSTFFSNAKNEQSPYSAVPEDAIFVIETPSFTDSWSELEKSPLWNIITKNKFYSSISDDAKKLDSIIKDNRILTSYFSDKHLVISAHMIKGDDYDFLFILDTHKDTKKLMPIVETVIKHSDVPLDKSVFNDKEYLHMQVKDDETNEMSNYYIYYQENLVYFSMKESIIKKAINTNADHCIKQLLPITYLKEEIPNGKIFKCYFNYKELVGYLRCFFSSSDMWSKSISEALSYTALDTELDEQEAKLAGITSVDLTSPSFIKALALCKPAKQSAKSVIPDNVALLVSISFSNFRDLNKKFASEYQQLDAGGYDNYKKSVRKIEQLLNINIENDIYSWIGSEINICKLPPASTSALDNLLIFVKTNNIDSAKQGLIKIMDQIRKRTPISFKTLDHLNHNIYQLEVKGLFKPLLGNWLKKMDKPYFTYIDDFVVFSNSPQELIRVIDCYYHGDVLSHSEKYSDFQNKFDNNNSLSIYMQMPRLYTNLYQYSNIKVRAELDENKEFLESFSQIGVQLVSKKGQFNTLIVAIHDSNANFNKTIQEMEESATDIDNIKFEAKVFMNDIPSMHILGDSIVSSYFSNGNKGAEGIIHGSIPMGVWKFYYNSGNLKGVVNFTNGHADKKAIFYQDKPESIPLQEMEYDNGVLIGTYIEYYLRGNRKAAIEYKDGRPHGDATFYYENGATKIEGAYRKGLKSGKWKLYSPGGELISKSKQN